MRRMIACHRGLTSSRGPRRLRQWTPHPVLHRGSSARAPAFRDRLSVTLLIGRIGAPEILEDEPIAYRFGPNEIGTYNYHHWVAPPVRMVRVILLRQLRASGKYQSVAELGSSAQGEFVLAGRLYDFEEVDNGSIAALVTMDFELLDRKTAQIVWTHFYSRSEPVQGKEIPDVVAALDHNLVQGLTEVSSGLDLYLLRPLPWEVMSVRFLAAAGAG